MTGTLERQPTAVSTPKPRRRTSTRLGWLLASLAATTLIAVASIAFGARVVSLSEIISALSGSADGIAQAAVLERIPRTLLALVAGAALGVSGAVMQGVTRNPLADPGILGVNTGAALAVVTGIAFFGMSEPSHYIWLALAGGAVTAVFVYGMGSMGTGGATPLKLALAGAATSAALSSLISAILLPRIDVVETFRFWQIGGVGGAGYGQLLLITPFLVVGTILSLTTARRLNALALGDDVAAGLGEHVVASRLLAAAAAVLLCGSVTAVAGPIGFVGLIVPHLCRLMVGVDHRWLLPFSAVAGAALLTAADVVGRVITRPEEIDAGIITALIGGPVFIFIVRRQRARSL